MIVCGDVLSSEVQRDGVRVVVMVRQESSTMDTTPHSKDTILSSIVNGGIATGCTYLVNEGTL